MCRHLAWSGPSRSLSALLTEPDYGLLRQSYAPRRQRHGTINADGFGAAWYVPHRAEPVRYRRAQPMWSDASFASLAPTIASGMVIAAVRSATVGTAADESCAAPFVDGDLAFSHNGRLEDWEGARRALAARIAPVTEAWCGVDSGLAFGLVAAARREGRDLPAALADAVSRLDPYGERLTFLATDGRAVAATVAGEALYLCRRDSGVLIASEPDDATGHGWQEIPDRHLLCVPAIPTGPQMPAPPDVRLTPLPRSV